MVLSHTYTHCVGTTPTTAKYNLGHHIKNAVVYPQHGGLSKKI